MQDRRGRETSQQRSGDGHGGADPSVAEALARARRHARAAAAEFVEALRALLDAAALATGGASGAADGALGRASSALEALAAALASDGRSADPALVRVLADALDAEIARWEARSRDDAEARAVLRAFLGLRELLWELGVRPTRGERARGTQPVRKRRVERVPVQQG
ncbi:MAG: hypothetical protein OEM49_10200 [Myxococcales bacterium]|nr:hypothetical protein [Myxococcales bacterium]